MVEPKSQIPNPKSRTFARAVVDATSVFVPRWRRDDWRREWHAELWYAPRDAVRLSAGAVPHALQLLQQHWSLDMVMQDIRYGCRMLRRNPAFALVASLTLALGIGATTAIFSIVNAVLWRDLPYRDARHLVQLWETNPDRDWTDAECAPANVADWRRQNQSFADMAAYSGRSRDAWVRNFALTGVGEPERLSGMTVTANFFTVLGVQSAVGRGFLPEEEWDGRDEALVISDGLWRRRFGGDQTIVGRTVSLDGRARTIVGVLPPDFRFNNASLDVWVPMGWTPKSVASTRRPHYLRVVARLKPGVSLPQAQDEMHRIAKDLEQRYPDTNTHMGVGVGPLQEWIVGPSRTALQLFLAAVAFVLLVACANVANLMLARGAVRARELAIRSALGASSTRLVRQMLTESVLLAAIGGAVGLVLAYAAVQGVIAYGPDTLPRLHEIRLDRAALAFTMLVTIVTGVVFGVVPARQGRVREVTASLRGSARQGSATEGSRMRHALVAAELALSLALLVSATLLVRSFVKLNRVDLGFNPSQAASVQVVLPRLAYTKPDDQRVFLDRLLERVRAVPGVPVAGAVQRSVLEGSLWSSDFTVEHRGPDDFGIQVKHNELSPGYIEAMGGRIIRGRDFSDRDRPGAPLTVLVNDTLVRKYFKPTDDPIGQRLNFDRPGGTGPWRTIIGVVRDFREELVDQDPNPTIYEAIALNTDLMFTIVMRTTMDATALAPTVRAIIHDLDPNLPVTAVQPLTARVDEALAPQRFVTMLMALFAMTGVALATVGLYGVLSYLAAQRTHEIGVRIALGASGSDVVRLVTRQALRLTAIGMSVGVVLALLTGRLMSGLLFGVTAADPLTYALVLVLLAVVAMCAVLAPVRRALRVSPLVALRAE
jgi:putative ABC transport system permease protein